MGRRRAKNTQRFFYDGYLQFAEFTPAIPNSSFLLRNSYVWDPTESVATRPLTWQRGNSAAYYVVDGNKNVSEVVDSDGSLAAHYEYAPFGAVILQRGESAATNPWRFSSEYAEDDTATVYYNYRHYEPVMGRWMRRDPVFEDISEYLYCNNKVGIVDFLGLYRMISRGAIPLDQYARAAKPILDKINILNELVDGEGRRCYDVQLLDLEYSSLEEINQAAEDAEVFVVGHGVIKDERFDGQKDFSWWGSKEPVVGFAKRNGEFIPLRELKVDAQNLFGCYISPRIRKQPSGSFLWWKRYTSSIDDYNLMYPAILKRIEHFGSEKSECCSPVRIVVFEGEFSNGRMRPDKLRNHGTKATERRWKK